MFRRKNTERIEPEDRDGRREERDDLENHDVPQLRRRKADGRCCSWKVDDVIVRRGGIEPLDLGAAALQREALVDIALVGDLVGVDRGWIRQQNDPSDALG